jgi:hypothetical protein
VSDYFFVVVVVVVVVVVDVVFSGSAALCGYLLIHEVS